MILIREEIPDLEKDSIEITLEEYFDFAKEGVMKALEKSDDDDDTISIINGNAALSSEITGRYGGRNVYYRLTVVSDETYFYQILYWTVKERRDSLEKDFYASAISLKPL